MRRAATGARLPREQALARAHTLAADRSAGLDLLLRAESRDHDEASALQQLLDHCAKELRCLTGALLVPDKNLELSWTADNSSAELQLVGRTQKHLLAWARLNNRAMVVNRPGGGAAFKILSCPLHDPNGGVLGLVALFRSADAEDFEPRDVQILEFVGRKAVAILDSEYDALTGLPNRSTFERRAQRALDRGATAVLYADIDELEAINGAFGLSAGDEVIQRVGTLVQQAAGRRLWSAGWPATGSRACCRKAPPRREVTSLPGSSLQ